MASDTLHHPADQNLQQEAVDTISTQELTSQQQSRQHTAPVTQGVSPLLTNPYTILIFALLYLATSTPANSQPAKKFFWCSQTTSKTILALPQPMNCTTDPRTELRTATVTLYTKTIISAEAYACFNVTNQICTKAFFGTTSSVQKDETVNKFRELHMCQRRKKGKAWSGFQLQNDSATSWFNQIPMYYSLGWVGIGCYSASNLFLKQSFAAEIADNHIITTLATTHNCNKQNGSCQTKDSTLIWNPQSVRLLTSRYVPSTINFW